MRQGEAGVFKVRFILAAVFMSPLRSPLCSPVPTMLFYTARSRLGLSGLSVCFSVCLPDHLEMKF